MKRRTGNADEYDVVNARRFYRWRRGAVTAIKRQMRRRERHEVPAEIVDILDRCCCGRPGCDGTGPWPWPE